MNKVTKYIFEEFTACEMCGADVDDHIVKGRRLNRSQKINHDPKDVTGITVSVVKCKNCNLLYCQPLPIPMNVSDHYDIPVDKYWSGSVIGWNPQYFANEISEAKEIIRFYGGMTSLDCGAGLGYGMKSLEMAGFDSYGFEPSQSFYDVAVNIVGIDSKKIKLGMMEELNYPENYFNFITFGAVLEHLYHPANNLERAIKWLKPGGVIHAEVPSSVWLISKIVNLYYWTRRSNLVTNLSPMHPPFHLYEFSLKSFEELGKRLNFKIERHYYEVCSIPHVPKLFQPLLRRIMELTNTGMQLVVYLKKIDNKE